MLRELPLPGEALVRHVVTFGRVLREAGLEVGPGRLADALSALDCVDLASRDDVYWALRTTLVTRREELEPFDRAFSAWFMRAPFQPPPRTLAREQRGRPLARRVVGEGGDDEAAGDADPKQIGWSADELLRQKDFAQMTSEEFARARGLIAEIATSRPRRTSRRLRTHQRGRALDLRALARGCLATGGDPIERAFRQRVDVPRKLVALCDVSGSMAAYTRALLLFLHALVRSGRGVEVFAFGTRLSRLTPDLRTRDPEQALELATRSAVDWASGTRIGGSLKAFNDVWGRRALSRGALVLIVSDGWERDNASLVGREMARLARAAHGVVWVNPLKGSVQYEPLAGGMREALPFVDRFVAGHNLVSLEELAGVLAGMERRHAA